MGSEVKVKAKFKGTSRRFEIPSSITWEKLYVKLTILFDLVQDFRVKYCDDENELVLISSQEELDEALKICQKKSGLLNLFIEDPSAPQTTDATSLNLEKRNQSRNQGKPRGMDSCYAAAASAIAPEFAAMNKRLQSKAKEEADQSNKPPVSINDEKRPETSAVSTPEGIALSGYVNFEEVMAKSKQQEQSNQQNATEKGTSRGWFDFNEGQRQQKPSNRGNAGNGKTKKNKKKRNCYSELASVMAPELASLKVKEPPKKTSEAVASESDDTDIGEPTSTVSVSDPPPETPGEPLNNSADFNQQQMIQNGQQRKIKRPRRPKRNGKKKSCYAQAALDIGPLYQAMNERLKVQQQQQQQISEEIVSLNDDSDGEEPQAGDSPSTETESFVFVNSSDGEPSLSPTSMETEQMDHELADDIVEDGPTGNSSTPPEQQMDSESSGETKEITENVAEDHKDLHVVVKEVLHHSLDFIAEQTAQRLQKVNLNPSRQVPSDEGSSSTDVDDTSKVLHKGITCDNCEKDIQGVRYKCGNCQDFDLCEACESKDGIHDVDHVFIKLKFPAPGIGLRHGGMVPIFKNSVYKKTHDKKVRRAAKKAEKEEKRQLKNSLKSQEKERKKEEKHLRKQKQEMRKAEEQQPTDQKAQKMARVYEKLKMEYVRDVSFPDGSVVSPGQKFLKTWIIHNAGSIAWNQWIKMECIEGGIMAPGTNQACVPHLEPGKQGEVSVEFIAPDLPGKYSSKWCLTYGLFKFGPQLWCEIEVAAPSNEDKEKPVQYDQTSLVNSAFDNDSPPVPNATLVEDTKLQAAPYLIVEDGSGSEYHSSEEIPETQQASDVPLSSMEVQQRQDLEWDAGCLHDVEVDVSADNEESFNLINFSAAEDVVGSNDSEDSDDEEDSDSSMDEITVLMPPCFIPDIPLSADPMPVKVECPKRSNSFNSKFLPSSFEPYLDLDDNNERSSLPTMSSSLKSDSIEIVARNSNEPTKVQSTQLHTPDADADAGQGIETPSGRISPIVPSIHRTTQTQKPVSRQPRITPGETVPSVSYPTTIEDRTHSNDSEIIVPTNVVSDVLSTAIDVVTNAGKAAFATVDNLFNSNVEASATYKPEEDCEVTIDRRSNTTSVDTPPPSVNRAPGLEPMRCLIEMGFADRRLNEQLLRKHKNDIRATIDELLAHSENEWSSQRH